ncbi:hypothetical protein RA955_13490 [Geobacillus proteiniphilus]|uniref:Uncharacterized protein n=1 Tax=Geobacillus proteiniphilus TaxID=860353 RepID=A0ABY9MCM4_9BACL|nr:MULTISPECIES: hypothetical protein [Geobacillus]OPX01391.1 hypothetical protein B1A75_15985 [Geobacillus sp. LEMMY01]WMJ15754.1 hypothetical protein RA955_13490 [Geobacillus proteiniphilus]
MLSVKELVQRNIGGASKKVSPVDEALKRFRDENGYDFLDMINNDKIRKKHLLKQIQKKDYSDNDFFEMFEDKQGE